LLQFCIIFVMLAASVQVFFFRCRERYCALNGLLLWPTQITHWYIFDATNFSVSVIGKLGLESDAKEKVEIMVSISEIKCGGQTVSSFRN
jgi:hypothetical protein